MARGKFYTDEQNRALLALFDDNSGTEYVKLGEMAAKYNIAPSHNADKLARQIGKLVAARTAADDAEGVDIAEEDMAEARLAAFTDALFSGVYVKHDGYGVPHLWLDYAKVVRTLNVFAPDRVRAVLENAQELQTF